MVYNIRDVVKIEHRDRVDALNPFPSTAPEYLSHYQIAVTDLIKSMKGDERKKLEKVAEKWTEEGIPADVQLK